ncbi:neuroblastoma-amplified sequence-like [Aphis craccivora]|uniref:Neuroblastoma-amplified sequence-like n=1 Tax=Aphis craccivora TaxID=307492 RepID=A0A6G0VU33_APHCR|nr:neuroblastoma-amplified sequence-like [Aphis craccivora]
MFVNFMVNNKEEHFDNLTIHFCESYNLWNDKLCKTIYRVSSIRYLGLAIDKHMKWNLHINNLLMRLRILSHSFYKFREILLMHVFCTVYLALYQAIIQYGLLIWGGLSANALEPLLIH